MFLTIKYPVANDNDFCLANQVYLIGISKIIIQPVYFVVLIRHNSDT